MKEKQLRNLLSNGKWALRETWQANPWITSGLVVVTILRGVAPAGIAVFARELINAFVEAAPTGTGGFSAVIPWLLLGFVFTLMEGVAPLAFQFLIRRLRDDINLDVSTRILVQASKLDLSFFEDPQHRKSIELAQNAPADRFSSFVSHLVDTATCFLQAISLLSILAIIEPLVIAVVGPCGLVYLIFKWRLSRQRYLQEQFRAPRRRWTSYFTSRLTHWQSVGEVKLLGLSDVLIGRFNELMGHFRDEDRKLHQRGFSGAATFAVLTTLAFYVVFAWLLFKAFRGGATVGDIAIFGAATSRLRVTLEVGINSISNTVEQTLHIANLRRFLAIPPRVPKSRGITPKQGRGEIEVDNVTFTYPGAAEATLHKVSLHIRPGEIIGVVGEAGAGKTTLVKLLCRLYDPDAGSIRFDGIDQRDLSLDYLHGQIGFLMQGFGRFEATAAENIAYGDWQRLQGNQEAIEELAKRAHVHDMIQKMPDGYNTMLGRMFGSVDLSGGQWQKLALSRAFARDASLLILDEPTSNMDARAEYRLFCQFRELANGRTTLLISHRFSTLSMADRIVVMDGGRIVEQGTHKELLQQKGAYADLYHLHRHQHGALSDAEFGNKNISPAKSS